MKNLRLRKGVAILTTATVVLAASCFTNEKNYRTEYTINQTYSQSNPDSPFASIKNSDIYIGNKDIIDKAKLCGRDDDIYIIDGRKKDDPNMCIIDSYQINNIDEMVTILEIMQEYEDIYPSSWNRTIKAMLNEWKVHNICSNINLLPKRTDHVDLNNKDEKLYNSKILTKILNN